MESKTITLANKFFNIPTSVEDSVRREEYFKKSDGQHKLTTSEQNLLDALHIDVESSKYYALRPYLARFFDQLPLCQSDTSLVLAKDCEVVHFVLWYVMFVDRQNVKQDLDKNNKIYKPLADISLAFNQEFIENLNPENPPPINPLDILNNTSSITTELDSNTNNPVVDSIFTLL
jgi:hypothetical protein